MSDEYYTVEEELRRLESFLQSENIENDYNYLRMEKGPKPFFYALIAFSHQLRFTLLNHYFLVFTKDSLVLLTKNKDEKFSLENMIRMKYSNIDNFTFKKVYGAYCIYFKYLDKDYYFYLSNRASSRFLDKIFNYPTDMGYNQD